MSKMRDMKKEQTEVIIANPIYDAVFKSLMTTGKGTNRNIAGYFVGVILGEEITEIDLLPQEYTYPATTRKEQNGQVEIEKMKLIRLDFVATIRTQSGEYKKVLIEIQKSQKPIDLLRFRTYLGEQYKQTDTITIKEDRIEQTLPIVIIYMLGFTLPGINTIALKAGRSYINLIGDVKIKTKSPFIESLTHDGYFIQVPRIKREVYAEWDKCSELKQMLSLFEQDNFVEANFTKKYTYPITNKNIKTMVETLAYISADPKVRREMQEEYWAAQNEIIWENQVAAKDKTIAVKDKEIAVKDKTIAVMAKEKTAMAKEKTAMAKEKTAMAKANAAMAKANAAKEKENEKLRRLLQEAGIIIPFA